jgi:hypothetical protein
MHIRITQGLSDEPVMRSSCGPAGNGSVDPGARTAARRSQMNAARSPAVFLSLAQYFILMGGRAFESEKTYTS